jgi:hypothetical protein
MESFDAVVMVADQILRNVANGKKYKTKVVVTPTAVSEGGVIVKVSALNSTLDTRSQASSKTRTVRVRVSVCGRVESHTGLAQAMELIEKLDRYFNSPEGKRLERSKKDGKNLVFEPVPNTRIIQSLSAEDSFIDSPDSTAVQDIQDDRILTITIPDGEEAA